ncbi:FG-GAP and VCBS repeat-containing protein [Streptomyces hygroscopicus]|uniref:FG-GAP and VCBS repeat-containing protein n=1 Tax=Streptomyces hygroscopicus TaxID=1912 RepID=UPI0007674EC7|nr:FG-GAP and VCBS repeat-containing protein [Streptomyces hygroscopicus]
MRNRTRGVIGVAVGAAVTAAVAAGASAVTSNGDGDQNQPSPTAAAGKTTPSDIDGDGYADLGIGAPDGTVSGKSKAGYVAVTYGAAKGVDTARHSTLTQASPGVPGTPEAGDHFGSAVVVGDVDGDGYSDLIVAANNESIGTTKQAGSVTVVFGAKGGLSSDAIAFHAPTATAYKHFGDKLAVGDYNHDGRDDIAISDGETVRIVSGAANLRDTATPKMTSVTPPGGGAGITHLSSGDINGDGFADLVTVAYQDDPADEGTLGVLPGSSSGLKKTPLGEKVSLWFASYRAVVGDINGDGKDDVVIDTGFADGPDDARLRTYPGTASGLDTANPVTWKGTAPSGEAARLTDINGDGHDDLVVSDTSAEAPGGYNNAGAITVFKGTKNWLTDEGAQTFSLDTEGVPGDMAGNDHFGEAIAPADYNGDGKPDLAVGVPKRTEGAGAVALLYAGTDGLTAKGSALIGPSDLGAPAARAAFGTELSGPATK